MVHLQEWSVVMSGDKYTAPECRRPRLTGLCKNHPKFPDNTRIYSSKILSSEGRVVETLNTKYLLGRIDPKYREWIRDNYGSYDRANPVKDLHK